MSVTTVTNYQCDGCGFETTEPDADRAMHATVHIEVSTTRRRTMMGIDGEPWHSPYIRRVEPVDAWVCGDCLNKVLAVINQRFEVAP